MATAQQLINKSLRLLGVLASGGAPTAAEAFDSLEKRQERIKVLKTATYDDGDPKNYEFYMDDLSFMTDLQIKKL